MKSGFLKWTGFVLFLLYLFVLVEVLFLSRADLTADSTLPFDEYARQSTNFIPFRTITRYWRVFEDSGFALRSSWFFNLAGNLILFLPMGIFLPALLPFLRGFFRTVSVTALLVCAVEGLQLVTRTGSCDVDDLILNLAGCVCGYALYALFRYLFKKRKSGS